MKFINHKLKLRIISLIYLIFVLAILSCSKESNSPILESFPPRELTVLVGAGEKTAAINAFFPQRLVIRAGDTVSWKMNTSGDPHSIIFSDQPRVDDVIPVPTENSGDVLRASAPIASMLNPKVLYPSSSENDKTQVWRGSGFINSGIMFPKVQLPPKFPLIETFSLKFDRPGLYPYVCGIHDFHQGIIKVESSTEKDVPEQTEINKIAMKEIEPLKEITDGLHFLQTSDKILDREFGSNDTNIYIVASGMGPPNAELTEFFPENLSISKGDTVVWVSSRWHSIVFNPDGSFPPMYTPQKDNSGEVQMIINPVVTQPIQAGKPFLGSGVYSSGLMGYGQRPGGVGYSLTFEVEGVFKYMCPIHPGMTGRIEVRSTK